MEEGKWDHTRHVIPSMGRKERSSWLQAEVVYQYSQSVVNLCESTKAKCYRCAFNLQRSQLQCQLGRLLPNLIKIRLKLCPVPAQSQVPLCPDQSRRLCSCSTVLIKTCQARTTPQSCSALMISRRTNGSRPAFNYLGAMCSALLSLGGIAACQ
jgi:hypothetical protein